MAGERKSSRNLDVASAKSGESGVSASAKKNIKRHYHGVKKRLETRNIKRGGMQTLRK